MSTDLSEVNIGIHRHSSTSGEERGREKDKSELCLSFTVDLPRRLSICVTSDIRDQVSSFLSCNLAPFVLYLTSYTWTQKCLLD